MGFQCGNRESRPVFANGRDFKVLSRLPSLGHRRLAGVPNPGRERPGCLGRGCSGKVHSLKSLEENMVILVMSEVVL